SIAAQIGVAMPEARVMALPEDGEGALTERAAALIREKAGKVDAVVAGPGMASGGASAGIAKALLASKATIALDAALLHALQRPTSQRPSIPILLPHAGELASLLD